jgi:hypothetical protein
MPRSDTVGTSRIFDAQHRRRFQRNWGAPAMLACRTPFLHPRFLRCLARPALERMRECARLLIAQKPCDRGYGKVPLLQIAFCEIVTQLIWNCGEAQSLGRQPTGERSVAHAELTSKLVRPCLAVRQERDDCILYTPSQGRLSCFSLRPSPSANSEAPPILVPHCYPGIEH